MIMSFLNVPRETKEIVTRDYLVSNEEFVIKEVRKGLLKPLPKFQTKIFLIIIIQVSICHITKGLHFFL